MSKSSKKHKATARARILRESVAAANARKEALQRQVRAQKGRIKKEYGNWQPDEIEALIAGAVNTLEAMSKGSGIMKVPSQVKASDVADYEARRARDPKVLVPYGIRLGQGTKDFLRAKGKPHAGESIPAIVKRISNTLKAFLDPDTTSKSPFNILGEVHKETRAHMRRLVVLHNGSASGAIRTSQVHAGGRLGLAPPARGCVRRRKVRPYRRRMRYRHHRMRPLFQTPALGRRIRGRRLAPPRALGCRRWRQQDCVRSCLGLRERQHRRWRRCGRSRRRRAGTWRAHRQTVCLARPQRTNDNE